jgi:hypothetical protein
MEHLVQASPPPHLSWTPPDGLVFLCQTRVSVYLCQPLIVAESSTGGALLLPYLAGARIGQGSLQHFAIQYYNILDWNGHCTGGSPRFSCILRAPGSARVSPQDLPYMLYLPGIDGTGLAASRQFPFLLTAFDLHSLTIPPHDRTSFKGLMQIIMCALY